MVIFLQTNPFFDAYTESDLLGKLIFIGLIILSIMSWSIIIYKVWMTRRVKRDSYAFKKSFQEQKQNPLDVQFSYLSNPECPNAFYILYDMLKTKTKEILDKNQKVASKSYLSPDDVDLLESCSVSTISSLTKYLDKNTYLLSTVVTLAPFLGLLGTVYGILTTFSGMKTDATIGSHQMVLGGLSLALTTTVVGLVDAIPALIGYNYLKNEIHNFDSEMNRFATDVLTSLEMHFREVE